MSQAHSWLRLTVAASLFMVPNAAHAELGGDAASAARDGARINATHRIRQVERFAVHEMAAANGLTIREYVGSDGKVFAVAWRGPFHPDYQQILGSYFADMQRAVSARTARRAPVVVEGPGFVFQSYGHLRDLGGRAYLPANLPPGVSAEDIQ